MPSFPILQERRQAYENLAARTGLEWVKSVTQALIQAERYGTPVGPGACACSPAKAATCA